MDAKKEDKIVFQIKKKNDFDGVHRSLEIIPDSITNFNKKIKPKV